MRVLVAYMTSTGNTKKVAEAIYGEINVEKDIRPIKEVQDIDSYDLVFLGFPTHQFGPDKKTIGLIKNFCQNGKKVALFVTHAAPETEPEVPGWMAKFKEAASNANMVGFFDCQGQMSGAVKLVLRLSTDKKMRNWAKIDGSQGQPDEARLDKARGFAREVMGSVK